MDAIVLPHDGDEPADLDDALLEGRRFVMLTPDDTVIADSLGDLMAHLVQGYAEAAAGEDAAVETLRLRYLSLAGLADMVAPAVFAGLVNNDEIDADALTEDELGHILVDDRLRDPAFTGEWTSPMPLMAMAPRYAPYTDVPRPTGNVHFFDPANEFTYLRTLEDVGLIRLLSAAELPGRE